MNMSIRIMIVGCLLTGTALVARNLQSKQMARPAALLAPLKKVPSERVAIRLPKGTGTVYLKNGIIVHQCNWRASRKERKSFKTKIFKANPEFLQGSFNVITQLSWKSMTLSRNSKPIDLLTQDSVLNENLVFSWHWNCMLDAHIMEGGKFVPCNAIKKAYKFDIDNKKLTDHRNGIQSHEIIRYLNDYKNITHIILTTGMWGDLRTNAVRGPLRKAFESVRFKELFPNVKRIFVLPTWAAMDVYNLYAKRGTVAGFFHLTC